MRSLPIKVFNRALKILRDFCRFFKLFHCFLFEELKCKADLVYVVEDANWSIRADGLNITQNLNSNVRRAWVDTSCTLYKNKIIHFGSSHVFESYAEKMDSQKNRYLVNFFHGKYGSDLNTDKRYELLTHHIDDISGIIYSTSIMKRRFLKFGIPEEKLFHVPIGVNVNVFSPLNMSGIEKRKKALGIPKNRIVIGSFQKDGEGWGEGLEPKSIKGPDVFIDVVKRINEKIPVFCLLSGPARGYVKRCLLNAGVPFQHHYHSNHNEIAKLYQITDLCIITSREEGGPKALLEAMSCGIPVVSTDVGMARDVFEGYNCGLLCDVDDIECLTASSIRVLTNEKLKKEIVRNGLKRVKSYDWSKVSAICEKVYRDIEENVS